MSPSSLAHDTRHQPVSYFVQLMVGSGKPSASHTRVTDWPRLAVAFTMLCLAWTVGGTEGNRDVKSHCENLEEYNNLEKRHFEGPHVREFHGGVMAHGWLERWWNGPKLICAVNN